MTDTPDMNDVAAAALRLIGAFEHGHSVGALETVLAADPLVIATALGLLASPVEVTARCTACGAHRARRARSRRGYPSGLHLVSEPPQS